MFRVLFMSFILNKLAGFMVMFKFNNTLSLIFSRLFGRRYGLNVYRIDGMDIIIDHDGGDENGTRACIVSGMYRRHLVRLSRDKVVNLLDLGANGGGFVLLLKLLGFQFNKIVALEMNPYTFSRMYFNVVHNVQGEKILLNEAIGGKEVFYSLKFGRGSTGDSLYDTSSEGGLMEIRGRTFDGIYSDYFYGETVNICKVDVEGAEFEVFEKLPIDVLRRIEYIIMEIHGDSVKAEYLLSKLRGANFTILNNGEVYDNVYFLKNLSIDEIPLVVDAYES